MIVRTYLPYYCRTRPTSCRPKPFLTDKPTIPAKRFCVTLTAYFMYLNLKPVQKDATFSPGPCVIPWAYREHFSFFEEIYSLRGVES